MVLLSRIDEEGWVTHGIALRYPWLCGKLEHILNGVYNTSGMIRWSPESLEKTLQELEKFIQLKLFQWL